MNRRTYGVHHSRIRGGYSQARLRPDASLLPEELLKANNLKYMTRRLVRGFGFSVICLMPVNWPIWTARFCRFQERARVQLARAWLWACASAMPSWVC
jgi:hypothetical protein